MGDAPTKPSKPSKPIDPVDGKKPVEEPVQR
jgi:hypothetical protein